MLTIKGKEAISEKQIIDYLTDLKSTLEKTEIFEKHLKNIKKLLNWDYTKKELEKILWNNDFMSLIYDFLLSQSDIEGSFIIDEVQNYLVELFQNRKKITKKTIWKTKRKIENTLEKTKKEKTEEEKTEETEETEKIEKEEILENDNVLEFEWLKWKFYKKGIEKYPFQWNSKWENCILYENEDWKKVYYFKNFKTKWQKEFNIKSEKRYILWNQVFVEVKK